MPDDLCRLEENELRSAVSADVAFRGESQTVAATTRLRESAEPGTQPQGKKWEEERTRPWLVMVFR